MVIEDYQQLIVVEQAESKLKPYLLHAQMNMGVTLYYLKCLPESMAVYKGVIEGYQELIDNGQTQLRPELLTAQMNWAIALSDLGQTPSQFTI